MKILITCQNFNYLSGSALYNYELARELVKLGHDVTVVSEIGGILTDKALGHGIEVSGFNDIFSLPDVIHSNQPNPTKWALKIFPNIPIVCTIHSQFIYEEPVIDDRIQMYISVKREVTEKLKNMFIHNIEQVPIPVDFERFKPYTGLRDERDLNKKKLVVCPMTIDHLRQETIFDLIRRSEDEDFDLWFVGKKLHNCLEFDLPDNVKWFDESWDIENYIKEADETAGIMLGKMTIESWACGKRSWVYTVSGNGQILSKELLPPPADIAKYDSKLIAKRMEQIYANVRMV